MQDLKYRRNWDYEQYVSVHFLDGREVQAFCRTNNKGQINYIILDDDGDMVYPEQFGTLGIQMIHFMTPAALTVRIPDRTLAKTYLRLGRAIGEGSKDDTNSKVRIREQIARTLQSRGHKLHSLLAEVNE